MNDTAQSQPPVQPQQQPAQQKPKIVQIGKKLQSNFQGGKTTSVGQKYDATDRLNTLDEVLDELQSQVPHGVVQAVDKATDTLNPSQPVGTAKERVEKSAGVDAKSIDVGAAVQAVEQEKNPEIPVEVESYLQKVEDHHETAPTQVVIADGSGESAKNNYPSQPVIVLPITQEEEKKGQKQSPKNSFRWLVEWSHKIIKMFTGKVIYKQE